MFAQVATLSKCHPALLLMLLTAACLPSGRAATGDSQVARWRDNKTACFLLMYDDSCPSHFQVAIPEMVKRDMIGTFYINPGGSSFTSNSNQWTNLIPKQGMVYGDHTWDHGNTTTLVAMDDEIRKCWKTIKGIYYPGDSTPRLISYGQPGVTTWYSYGQPLTDILTKYNLVSRPAFIASQAPFTGINTLPQLLAVADTAITNKAMGYTIFHGLQRRSSEGDPDMGGQDFWAFDKDVYRNFLDGLKTRRDSGNLWITDPISYHKYETERNSAAIQVTAATNALITLTLSATANTLYDLPLTVTTQVPAAWKAAVVSQGSQQTNVPVTGGTVQYDALPNGGTISVRESSLPVVTVKATVPEAYETGAVPGVFTISTTGAAELAVNYTITGTAANGTRYTMAAGPLTIGAGSSSATVSVAPVPNTVYEGEQSVVLTITADPAYAVGPGGSAIVMIHDRTDLPPSDWYLHANQASVANSSSDTNWNSTATWWSQPTGGTKFTGFTRGSVSDRFHNNGYTLNTKNAYYPPDQSFYGNNVVLDGPAGKLALTLTAYYGSSGMPTNTIPSLTSNGGSIIPSASSLTQLLTVGTFNSTATTKISNGANAGNPACGLNLKVTKLTGAGDLNLTNAIGTPGTTGSMIFNISNATNYRGKFNLIAGTLNIQTNLTSSGSMAVATGSAVTTDKIVKVARLMIGNKIVDAGTYTAAQLNGQGATFSGAGTITTSLLPDGWSTIDVGSPAMSGSATYAGTTWTVTGGGTLIGGTADKLNFVSALTSSANPTIIAKLTSVQNTSTAAQAGVMLRDSTDTGAPFVAITVSPAGTITFRSRTASGAAASSVQGGTAVAAPVWLKLAHAAGTCTGYYSTDNATWTQVGTASLSFPNTPQAGLAVCAGTDTVKNVSMFDSVSLDGQPPVLNAYTVSTGMWPAGAGTLSGSGIYQSGTSVTVAASAASGYGFVGWTESGNPVTPSASFPFTVAGHRSLTANFQPAGQATFRTSYFSTDELNDPTISGMPADADGDGIPNIMEYALARNPKIVDPPLELARFSNDVLSLTYRRSKTAADLAYVVEVSNDLKAWYSSPADVSAPALLTEDGSTQTIEVKDLVPASSAGQRFIRLRVTAQ